VADGLLFEDFIDVDGAELAHLIEDLAYHGSTHCGLHSKRDRLPGLS
jgi:hypothetical protein